MTGSETCEPALRAVVEPLGESAMAQAEAMDADRGRAARALGPTDHDQDQRRLQGLPNSNGIPALNQIPCVADAPVVANLRAGGVVPIGRSSTPEFSLRWFTSNPIYGRTLNPWDKA
ncbi:MAG: amidase family protein [Paracoccaceae bacterium]